MNNKISLRVVIKLNIDSIYTINVLFKYTLVINFIIPENFKSIYKPNEYLSQKRT